jgi:hypothetical protein
MPGVLRDTDPERVARRVSNLEDAPLATARAPLRVELVAGDNPVRHGLPRARGRIVVRASAAVDLIDVDSTDPAVWVINASGPAVVHLVFF